MELVKEFLVLWHDYRKSLGRNSTTFLLLITLIGIILSLEIRGWRRAVVHSKKETRYLVLKRKIHPGERISQIDLGITTFESEVSQDALTDQELHLVDGARAIREINEGRPILPKDIVVKNAQENGRFQLSKGFRLYELKVENNIPLKRGDLIDVLLIPQSKNGKVETLLEGIRFFETPGKDDGIGRVLVAVQPNDLAVLEKGRQLGKLIIVLRNPADAVHENDLHKRRSFTRIGVSRQVDIITE